MVARVLLMVAKVSGLLLGCCGLLGCSGWLLIFLGC